MTPKQLEARISEAIAQETGCVPMWEDRPLTWMQVMRVRQRIAALLNEAQEEVTLGNLERRTQKSEPTNTGRRA